MTGLGGERWSEARVRMTDIRDRLDDAIELTAKLTTLEPELDEVSGVGSAPDGEVVATVDRYGVLIDLRVRSAALAGGVEGLRTAVLTAVAAATLDMRRQTADITGEVMASARAAASFDETVALLERMFDGEG